MNLENMDQLFEDSLNNLEIKPKASVKAAIKKGVFLHNLLRSTYLQLSVVLVVSTTTALLVWNYWPNEEVDIKTAEVITEVQDKTEDQIIPVNFDLLAGEENAIEVLHKNEQGIDTEQQTINNHIAIKGETENNNIINNDNQQVSERADTFKEEDLKKHSQNKFKAKTTEKIAVQNNTITQVKAEENTPVLAVAEAQKGKKGISLVEETNYRRSNNESLEESKISESGLSLEISESKGLVENELLVEAKDDKKAEELDQYVETLLDEQHGQAGNQITEGQSYLTTPLSLSENYLQRRYVPRLILRPWVPFANIDYPNLEDFELYEDTLGFDILGQPIVVASNAWRISAHLTPNYSLTRLKSLSVENEENSDVNQSALAPQLDFGFGLELSYQFKQVELGGGIAYTQLAQDFKATNTNLLLNNVTYWDHFEQEVWQVDSVPIFNLDSLLQGDTTSFVIVMDSTKFIIQDSVEATRVDTNYTNESIKKRNTYRYFEIPLFVQYNFNKGRKLQPFVRLGWVTGLHIRTQGAFAKSSSLVADLDETPFMKISFWANAGLGLSYQWRQNWNAILYVNYKYNVNGILQRQDYYNQYVDNIGVSVGVGYRF